MNKHTKGPWRLFNEEGIVSVLAPSGKEVVKWTGFDASDYPKAAVANACLIAAAPDLLEAADNAVIFLMGKARRDSAERAIIENLRAAIARAIGDQS